eukprot:4417464-Amphidinium_carterae.1
MAAFLSSFVSTFAVGGSSSHFGHLPQTIFRLLQAHTALQGATQQSILEFPNGIELQTPQDEDIPWPRNGLQPLSWMMYRDISLSMPL